MPGSEKREPVEEEQAKMEEHDITPIERASDVATSNEGTSQHEGEESSPKKKDKYDKSGPHPIVGLIIFAVLQFVALLFMTIATPIEMYTLNDTWRDRIFPELQGTSKSLCVTAWGVKQGCRSRSYYNRDFTNNFCYRVRTNFKIVQAFCIMTIAFMTIALLLAICSIFQKVSKGSTASVGTFAMILAIIPWGVLAGMFWQRPCCETTNWHTEQQTTICHFSVSSNVAGVDVPPFRDMSKYGAGFGLLVTAWCLQFVGTVFAFVPL